MNNATLGTSSRTVRIAVALVVVAAIALVPKATPAAAEERSFSVTLGYGCRFPAGTTQGMVTISGKMPSPGVVGRPVQPDDVTVRLRAPRKAFPGQDGAAAADPSARAKLGIVIVQNAHQVSAEWPDLATTNVASRGEELTLTMAGEVAPMIPSTTGDIVISAGELDLRIRDAGEGAADQPVSCTPNLGQDTKLATVRVPGTSGGAPPGSGSEAPVQGARSDSAAPTADDPCPPLPPDEFNKDLLPFPEPPVPVNTSSVPIRGCVNVDGLSNVNKLDGAAPAFGPTSVIVNKEFLTNFSPSPGYAQARSIAQSLLEQSEATFLTFGFVPTTAKMEVTQVGNAHAVSEGPALPSTVPVLTDLKAFVSIRIFDVRVNGAPLDVGPNCRTARPTLLTLSGRSDGDPPYLITRGGEVESPASARLTIPPFSGCGAGEDLDRLFTASVSGDGNFVRLLQSPLCDPTVTDFRSPCPPRGFGYKIVPGGDWNSASGPVNFLLTRTGDPSSIQCRSSDLTGKYNKGDRVNPTRLGTLTRFTFNGCTGQAGAIGGMSFTVEPRELPWDIGDIAPGLNPTTGILTAAVGMVGFRLRSSSCSFDVRPPSASSPVFQARFVYSNAEKTHTWGTYVGTIFNVADTCPAVLKAPGIGFQLTSPTPIYPGIGQTFEYALPFR